MTAGTGTVDDAPLGFSIMLAEIAMTGPLDQKSDTGPRSRMRVAHRLMRAARAASSLSAIGDDLLFSALGTTPRRTIWNQMPRLKVYASGMPLSTTSFTTTGDR